MQGSSSKCGRPGPGKADCLEGQTQDPGQVGEWGVSGGRPAYPWCPCLHHEKPVRGQDQGSAQEPSFAIAWEDQAGR